METLFTFMLNLIAQLECQLASYQVKNTEQENQIRLLTEEIATLRNQPKKIDPQAIDYGLATAIAAREQLRKLQDEKVYVMGYNHVKLENFKAKLDNIPEGKYLSAKTGMVISRIKAAEEKFIWLTEIPGAQCGDFYNIAIPIDHQHEAEAFIKMIQ